MRDSKLWLVGMWRGNKEILQKTVEPIAKYFDGIIAVVDSKAKPEDIEWLNTIKGGGEIIVKKWVNDHSHSMNEILFTGKMEFPDFFCYIDETDKLNETFVQGLRGSIQDWHRNGIGAIWLDHPFIIRYHDGVRFAHSPHWTVINILGQSLNLTQGNSYNKESYLFNLRDDDKLRSAFLSPIKYWFEYPAFSNHTALLYLQFGEETYRKHEGWRIGFRLSCKYELGIELTLEGLKKYLIENVNKYPDWFEDVLEKEVNLIDAFRLFVLNQPWQKLAENRFNFSYFTWKNTGKIDQGKNDGYVGLFNVYRKQQGKEME